MTFLWLSNVLNNSLTSKGTSFKEYVFSSIFILKVIRDKLATEIKDNNGMTSSWETMMFIKYLKYQFLRNCHMYCSLTIYQDLRFSDDLNTDNREKCNIQIISIQLFL